MLTRHCISYIYIKPTVYHNDNITITQPTHNSTEELLYPNIIKVARCQSQSKIVTRPLSTMGVNTCTLESMVSYHYLPAFKTRQIQPPFQVYLLRRLLAIG